MKFSIIFFLVTLLGIMSVNKDLFDFNSSCNLDRWQIVNDGVMGGLSKGSIALTDEGHALFSGQVSLENYGGFTSVRYRCNSMDVRKFNTCNLRVKGDKKSYQFRVKSDGYDRHSYIYSFETSGEWEDITIPLDQMIPSFRGRQLDMPSFPGEQIEEVTLLIGNKRKESFSLLIDRITLE